MEEKRFPLTPRVLIAAFVFTLLALLSPASTHAAGPPSGAMLYVVQYGDTLESIAARFGVPVEAIIQANGLTRSYMYVGQRMYMTSPYTPATYSSSSTYIVQPGDTLFGIAQRFGVPMYTLMRMNYLYNPNLIYAGMALRMPRANYAPSSYQTYLVRFGDTLSSIALRFGTSIYALMIANNIPNPNLIFAGMRLVIPTAKYSTNGYPPAPQGYPTPATIQPTPSPVTSLAVSLRNIAYNPRAMTVHIGAKVVWTNNESSMIPHTVTSGTPGVPNGSFDSGTLNPGQNFQFTFNSAGTFAYYCRIHGAAMTGTVTVVP